jgi:3-hydroxyacyl-CoA dehydrogenase
MSELVQLTQQGDVAVISINNPPVNALGSGVIEGLAHALRQVEADKRVNAVVVIGGGRTFVAGADIHEFQRVTSGEAPRTEGLLLLLPAIEACSKPVVMAIHGNAFGGGLELALAGHYRVATPDAQVGQPEVKLGLIPGAGGTQRLPRLAGVTLAVEMCATGNPISAAQALKAGILDRLIEGDLLTGAVAFAREVVGKPLPRARDRFEKLGTPETNAPIFAAARDAARKKQRGWKSPQVAIELVEAATRVPFEEGLKLEQTRFRECLFSDQSKALVHVFFGEREVAKVPDIPKDIGRRHHGRRYCHGFCQCRRSGVAAGSGSGGARPRLGQHSKELCRLRAARPLHSTVCGGTPAPHQAHPHF